MGQKGLDSSIHSQNSLFDCGDHCFFNFNLKPEWIKACAFISMMRMQNSHLLPFPLFPASSFTFSFFRSLGVSKATPTWAVFKAPTSFVPSPHIKVTHPAALKTLKISSFWSGETLAKTYKTTLPSKYAIASCFTNEFAQKFHPEKRKVKKPSLAEMLWPYYPRAWLLNVFVCEIMSLSWLEGSWFNISMKCLLLMYKFWHRKCTCVRGM